MGSAKPICVLVVLGAMEVVFTGCSPTTQRTRGVDEEPEPNTATAFNSGSRELIVKHAKLFKWVHVALHDGEFGEAAPSGHILRAAYGSRFLVVEVALTPPLKQNDLMVRAADVKLVGQDNTAHPLTGVCLHSKAIEQRDWLNKDVFTLPKDAILTLRGTNPEIDREIGADFEAGGPRKGLKSYEFGFHQTPDNQQIPFILVFIVPAKRGELLLEGLCFSDYSPRILLQ